jgi:hypothetical protein
MKASEFKKRCESLEKLGWWLADYQPQNKYAVYTNGTSSVTIGANK